MTTCKEYGIWIVLLVLASSVAGLVRVPPITPALAQVETATDQSMLYKQLHVGRFSGVELTNQSDLESANTTLIPAQAKLKGAS
jgi:hypothetical protein